MGIDLIDEAERSFDEAARYSEEAAARVALEYFHKLISIAWLNAARAERMANALRVLLDVSRRSSVVWHIWADAEQGVRCIRSECAACAAEKQAEEALLVL